jgi:hypothetical protein
MTTVKGAHIGGLSEFANANPPKPWDISRQTPRKPSWWRSLWDAFGDLIHPHPVAHWYKLDLSRKKR